MSIGHCRIAVPLLLALRLFGFISGHEYDGAVPTTQEGTMDDAGLFHARVPPIPFGEQSHARLSLTRYLRSSSQVGSGPNPYQAFAAEGRGHHSMQRSSSRSGPAPRSADEEKDSRSRQQERGLAGATVMLDFEGIPKSTDPITETQVGDFYNGGNGGPLYGIRFSASAVAAVDRDAGGYYYIANEPSPNTTLYFSDPDIFSQNNEGFMSVDGGFTSLSFKYSGQYASSIVFYDGPSATGNIIYQGTLSGGGTCSACGDPNGNFGIWLDFSKTLPAVAKSVRFTPLSNLCPFIDNMVIALINLPTRNPTKPPTAPPTQLPTGSPTGFPTVAPTDFPTDSPTASPTKAPTTPPTCNGTSLWVYNATTRAPTRVLRNNSIICVVHPYNIEVRPCPDQVSAANLPVSIRLVQQASKGRHRAVVHRQQDWEAPFFLFGNARGTGAVRSSPVPLPNGNYIISTSVGGTIVFTQSCPCPAGKMGKKRCMRKQI
jgi:hypothetical protein